jgi:hypothetical protein
MSSFTDADLRVTGNKTFTLVADMEYHVGEYPSENKIVVPKGFVSDLASSPRALWAIFPPIGRYTKAALLHDWLYTERKLSRKQCDEIFIEAMEVLGVRKSYRYPMYWAVRAFGQKNYKGNK